ncbi:hypothetical protein QQS21_000475 [Conoideocrella luteorostrata]|uniref:Translation initiation factor IF-3 n=1 Tax=Conoideocrella luteorostrata TaxID=1105319 RepID=A0AAJ0CZ02_9HYPO|nr:hypothetical protein QQS21_000475 [Conoideocrella luteorostrata]
MRPTKCVYSPCRALYRVFISPAGGTLPGRLPSTTTFQQRSLSRPEHSPLAIASRNTTIAQIRHYATKPPARGPRGPTSAAAKDQVARDDRGFDKRYTTQKDIERSGRDRPPQDHEITDPQIMVIDNGATEGPLSTPFVLSKLEPHESLRMIQAYVPADPKNGRSGAQYAVCKIVNRKDEYERQKQLKAKKKAATAKPKTKELELTWAIGDHDLATKMRQMGGFLGKGLKVEVLVAKKKGGKQVDGKEAEGVVKRIRDEVESHGGREAKPATGQAGGTMRLYLEGKQGR